jgi:hypothetical protein
MPNKPFLAFVLTDGGNDGAHAIVEEALPGTTALLCIAHSMHLLSADLSKRISFIREALLVTESILQFIAKSPKMRGIFEKCVTATCGNSMRALRRAGTRFGYDYTVLRRQLELRAALESLFRREGELEKLVNKARPPLRFVLPLAFPDIKTVTCTPLRIACTCPRLACVTAHRQKLQPSLSTAYD